MRARCGRSRRVENMTSRCTKSAMSWPATLNWQRSMHAAFMMNSPGWRWSLCHVRPLSRSLNRSVFAWRGRMYCSTPFHLACHRHATKDLRMTTSTLLDNAALFAVLSSLADNKQAIGRRYAYWSNGAPALEAAVAAAAMTPAELGHARTLYPLLEDFAQGQADPSQVEPMTRTLHYHLAFLDKDFAGWCDFVSTNFLLDTALTTFFEAAQHSSYEPLRQRARKLVQEEHIHAVHGEA